MVLRKKGGFTLVELAVAMSVSSLCIIVALSAWVGYRGATLRQEERYRTVLKRELFLQSLGNRLAKGYRLDSWSESSLVWIDDATGKRVVLDWSDSIALNGERMFPAGYTLRCEIKGNEGVTDVPDSARLIRLTLMDSLGSSWDALFRN